MDTRLSNQQKKQLGIIGAILAGLLLLWVVFAPGQSAFQYSRVQKKLSDLETDIQKLKTENESLRAEIDKLRNDPVHQEELARKKYGLLKQNEVIYSFPKPKAKE